MKTALGSNQEAEPGMWWTRNHQRGTHCGHETLRDPIRRPSLECRDFELGVHLTKDIHLGMGLDLQLGSGSGLEEK